MASMLSVTLGPKLTLGLSMSGTKLAHANNPVAAVAPMGPLQIEAMKKIQGWVVCTLSDMTIAPEVTRSAPHVKYLKCIKLIKKYHVHDSKNECNIGNTVTLAKCKPVSKSKTFVVVEWKAGQPRGKKLPVPILP